MTQLSGSIGSWITLSLKDWDGHRTGNTNDSNNIRLNVPNIQTNAKKTPLKPLAQSKESEKKIEKPSIKASVNTQAKIDYVAWLRWNTGYATLFITECKQHTANPDHCIMRWSAIAKHESNAGRASNAFLGVLVDRKQSYDYQIRRRVQRYNKNHWYKRMTVRDRQRGWYCMHENDWTPGCPVWNSKVWTLANKYDNLF